MKNLSIWALIIVTLISTTIYATDNFATLNNVVYQITEQQWLKTDEATATVSINATVSEQDVPQLRQKILNNLQKIAAGDWHITQFNRDKTSSGLQSVNAQAEIRLPSAQLDSIYKGVKSVSTAGQTYQVVSLSFQPTTADVVEVQNQLRQKIYADVTAEIKRLNTTFSDQQYFLHDIRFGSVNAPVMQNMALVRTPEYGSSPNISQQISLSATIVLSSQIKGVTHAN